MQGHDSGSGEHQPDAGAGQAAEAAQGAAHPPDAGAHGVDQLGNGVDPSGHLDVGHHAADAAAHAGDGHGDDIGSTILHHITDSDTIDLWGLTWNGHPIEFQFPHWEVFGVDISLSKHVVFLWLASALLIALFAFAFRGRKLVPSGLANVLEMLVVFVRDEICVKNMGEKDGKRLAPYMLTLFFFILVCNLIGLMPFGSTATGNVNVTAGLAIMSFLLIQVQGIKEHGFMKHWKNLLPHGLPVFVIPIMIVVEILGMFVKPFALCVRLFANMTAGHVAILAFLGMIFIFKSVMVSFAAVPLALAIYGLEIFVSFLQAYIFTMLTSLFVGFSLNPSH